MTGRRDRAFLSRESLQNTRCGKEDERTFMNFLNKMERKFGRYAIHNLSTYIIGAYVIGYFLYFLAPGVLYNYLSLEPYYILRGQIWRLITWVLIPPESPGIFTIIMLMLYYSLGNSLEQTWGAFRYNAYIFSGIISTIIGAFILYAVMGGNIVFGQALFSTYYINMSIFLALQSAIRIWSCCCILSYRSRSNGLGFFTELSLSFPSFRQTGLEEWRSLHPCSISSCFS